MAAIIVATFHEAGEDNQRKIIGPFKDGDAATRWGAKAFPNNKNAQGETVTWCWEDLIDPLSPYAEHISAK